jgi:hypothetical protein
MGRRRRVGDDGAGPHGAIARQHSTDESPTGAQARGPAATAPSTSTCRTGRPSDPPCRRRDRRATWLLFRRKWSVLTTFGACAALGAAIHLVANA